jgi:hypothetical protein
MSEVFELGQVVVAVGSYCHSLTEGKEYTVVEYTAPVVSPTFTWPAYVTVVGDLGERVTAHTYRFKPLEKRHE